MKNESDARIDPRIAACANLGQNLLIARKVCGLTQIELEENSGVSRATIAQIENGSGDPSLSTIFKIAAALHITPLLLMMNSEELRSIEQATRINLNIKLAPSDVQQMEQLIRTAIGKNRIRAAQIGVKAAEASKSRKESSAGAMVGAAIGSLLFPGLGTLIGASFGYSMMNKSKSVGQAASPANSRESKAH